MNPCGIDERTGRCSRKGTKSRELCELSEKNSCRRVKKTVKLNRGSQPKRQTRRKKKGASIMDAISQYKRVGVSFLEQQSQKTIENMLIKTNDLYRMGKPVISDNQYDILEKYARERYPAMKFLNKVGVDVKNDRKKVRLPYFMASMDKIKNDPTAIERFKGKYNGPYVISDKLDGISGMYYCKAGESPRLYTRGNGSVGQDISHLLPYIQGVPRIENCSGDLVIRGELIVRRVDYEGYRNKYSTSRNMVNSVALAKRLQKEEARKIHFVSYELIIPERKPSEQLQEISSMGGFEVVYNRILRKSELSTDRLSDILQSRRRGSDYDIDGIIVMDDRIYSRQNRNPEHAFAFKMLLGDQMAETLVMGVEWNASKDGYLKPRVKVETTNIGGVDINYVTGNNAKFILDNKIGVGARILLVRSGDVIPKIERVIEAADVVGLPPEGSYEWNDTRVDIMVVRGGSPNDEVEIQKIKYFFSQLGTEQMRIGNIRKLYSNGYKRIRDYVHLKASDIERLEGFQSRSSRKIEEAIQKSLREASLLDLMSASNALGRGFSKKRLELIVGNYPDAFNVGVSEEERLQGLLGVKGMALITAQQFINNLPMFYQFAEENDIRLPSLEEAAAAQQEAPRSRNQTLAGMNILFTGFRDKDMEATILSRGGKIVSGVSGKLSVLVAKDKNSTSGKVKKAKDLGIMVLSKEEFVDRYLS